MNNKIEDLSLCFEVELAIFYITRGVKEIKNISLSNDFYHLPILCLTTGFERLMKCIIIADFYILQDKLLSKEYKYIRNLGHDLIKLLNVVTEIGKKSQSLINREATKKDSDFIENNKEFRKFMTILSDFSTFGRYYNLNSLFDNANDSINDFMKFELEIAIKNNISIDIEKDPYPKINNEIVKLVEIFTRALSRFFTLGDFKNLGKFLSIKTYDFLFLKDDQLGECSYLNKNY